MPREPIETDVLIPALSRADTVDFAVGYFNSAALRSIGAGLADFINNTSASLRLITSPQLEDSDYLAIQRGKTEPISVLAKQLNSVIDEVKLSTDLLANHTLDCLSYLVANKRLVLKLAWVQGGIFHPKMWVIRSGREVLVVSGSQNLTGAGLNRNVEQMRVDRSWGDSSSTEAVMSCRTQFDLWWNDNDESARTFDASSELLARIKSMAPQSAPGADKYQRYLDLAAVGAPPRVPEMVEPKRLKSPEQFDIYTGNFEHQGRAVDSWLENGAGVLEMATGSGKTITALSVAVKHNQESPKVVFVAVPITPLGKQWGQVADQFSVPAVNAVDIKVRSKRISEIRSAIRRVESRASFNEVVIVTHDFLCSDAFRSAVSETSIDCMLIADEVHHLGRQAFRTVDRSTFSSVLGLSATPHREWDDDGNALIESFFGPVIFSFTLAEAIGKCLVPYEYHIHEIPLTPAEELEYETLTSRAKALGWMMNSDDVEDSSALQKILLDRRKVLEIASGKLDELTRLIDAKKRRELSHTLIYASDKFHGQIDDVNDLMKTRRIRFHQFTGEETSDRDRAEKILANFREGELQVLTAMRVLDEGVDIPEVKEAIILASNTGERQWIQRRGRVLRMNPDTGKKHAVIHDFVVTANSGNSTDAVIDFADRSEFARVMEFASLAMNSGAQDGPLVAATRLIGG